MTSAGIIMFDKFIACGEYVGNYLWLFVIGFHKKVRGIIIFFLSGNAAAGA